MCEKMKVYSYTTFYSTCLQAHPYYTLFAYVSNFYTYGMKFALRSVDVTSSTAKTFPSNYHPCNTDTIGGRFKLLHQFLRGR